MIKKISLIFILLIALSISIQSCERKSELDVAFLNSLDNIKLSGTLTLPQGNGPFPGVVLVTGSGPHTRDTQIGNYRIMLIISEYLAKNGIASICYDKRGCGHSGGVYEPHDIEGFTNDAIAAASFLATVEKIDSELIGAIGLSQGGIIVPAMSIHYPDLAFIILMAAPGVWGMDFALASSIAIARASGFNEQDISSIQKLYDEIWPIYTQRTLSSTDRAKAIKLLGELSMFMDSETRTILNMKDVTGYFDFMRSRYVLKSMDDDPADVLRQVKCPVLAVTGSKDVQIPPGEHITAIENALRERKNQVYKIKEFQNLNHLFQRSITGLPSEYLKGNKPMEDEVLEFITKWIIDIVSQNQYKNSKGK